MVLDCGRRAVLLPVFLNGAHAMRADGDDLFDFVLRKGFEIGLGQLLEDEIVAQAADRVAGAFFFAQDAIACAQVIHDAGEVGDDLAALGVVAAHAAQPQTIFLRPVEDGQACLLDELVALAWRASRAGCCRVPEPERASMPYSSSQAPVLTAPRRRPIRMGRCSMPTGHWNSQAPQVVHWKGGFLGVVLAQQRLLRRRAKVVR